MTRTKPKPMNPFVGRWRIVSMEQWDQDYVDEEEEGYFEFNDKGSGEFHFGYVHERNDANRSQISSSIQFDDLLRIFELQRCQGVTP